MLYDVKVFGFFTNYRGMNTEEQPTIVIKGRTITRKEIDKFVNEGIFLVSEHGNDYIPPHLVLKDRSSFILTKDEARKVVMFMREYPDEG
jgi:hypothetical protein